MFWSWTAIKFDEKFVELQSLIVQIEPLTNRIPQFSAAFHPQVDSDRQKPTKILSAVWNASILSMLELDSKQIRSEIRWIAILNCTNWTFGKSHASIFCDFPPPGGLRATETRENSSCCLKRHQSMYAGAEQQTNTNKNLRNCTVQYNCTSLNRTNNRWQII